MDRLIELNADVGEGGPDGLLMPLVDRVSIACGGHAGDIVSMRQALLRAKELGIQPGAHPGYPDPANFGRNPMAATPAEISDWIIGQTRALMTVADGLGMKLFHVKPHGALYNQAAVDKAIAEAVIAALLELKGLTLIALAGSPLAGWASTAGLAVLEEAFADRRYLQDGQLAPRNLPGAIIEEPGQAARQAQAIARGLAIEPLGGGALFIRAQTICLHGDGRGAQERAEAVASALRGNRI
jgi:UPF0271 protein